MTENNPYPQATPEIPDLSKVGQLSGSLRSEIQKVVYGQSDTVNQIIAALLAGGHVLLEGKPGLGKTHMVLALASTFGGEFGRLQFTPDMMPSDITGFTLFDMKSQSFQTRRGPVFTNLLLADEINRAPAKTQAALLEVMQEQQVTIDGESLPVAPPLVALMWLLMLASCTCPTISQPLNSFSPWCSAPAPWSVPISPPSNNTIWRLGPTSCLANPW